MFFELKTVTNKKLEKDYKKMMSELNEFYSINWVRNLPKIYFMESLKQIDLIRGIKTADWIVGWTNGRDVFALKNSKMEKESSHKKYSDKEYYAFIKHELSHNFTNVLSSYPNWQPKWLWEGIAIYTSGQNKFKTKIDKFIDFLDFYNQESASGVYRESGFAVELLVKKFGKNRLLNLIKNIKNYPSKELFEIAFKKQYGFFPQITLILIRCY